MENRGGEQLTAQTGHSERYPTLADYRDAANQDLSSGEACGLLPEKIDVQRLHAETSSYADRARRLVNESGSPTAGSVKE